MTLNLEAGRAAVTLRRTVEARSQGPRPQKEGKGPQWGFGGFVKRLYKGERAAAQRPTNCATLANCTEFLPLWGKWKLRRKKLMTHSDHDFVSFSMCLSDFK